MVVRVQENSLVLGFEEKAVIVESVYPEPSLVSDWLAHDYGSIYSTRPRPDLFHHFFTYA